MRNFVTKRILKTESADQRHETGRLKHAKTEKSVTTYTLDEMVELLNQRPETNKLLNSPDI